MENRKENSIFNKTRKAQKNSKLWLKWNLYQIKKVFWEDIYILCPFTSCSLPIISGAWRTHTMTLLAINMLKSEECGNVIIVLSCYEEAQWRGRMRNQRSKAALAEAGCSIEGEAMSGSQLWLLVKDTWRQINDVTQGLTCWSSSPQFDCIWR